MLYAYIRKSSNMCPADTGSENEKKLYVIKGSFYRKKANKGAAYIPLCYNSHMKPNMPLMH